jgi:Phage integrase family
VLPLTGELAALIERRWQARVLVGADGSTTLSPLVFHREGRPIGDFRKAWATATNAAGLPDLLFHDLRRSAVRTFERSGITQATAMKLTGHKTAAVYRRYAVTSEAGSAGGVIPGAADHRGAARNADRDTAPPRARGGIVSWSTAQIPHRYDGGGSSPPP